ncbi:SRPBCC family protein [Actinomadura namibiensis]|uniref:Uncharacterized protein n=1 Tax=Actinomadura namibiensis TaxID=182080 RepID=A0A7W3LRG0_ACTNM|nr:SRPBCC family protein [Actinomadura namibiensis]MBA8952986.1 hypothetical protein [Actinomadura namibiensis]
MSPSPRTWNCRIRLDGLGIALGKGVTRERITALDPERRFAYEGVEIPQMADYRAAVELHGLPGGGTRIHWHGTYRARRGMRWFFQWYLRRFMQAMATGLAEHAAALPAPPVGAD